MIDGSVASVSVLTGSSEVAYRAWVIALVTFDAPTARALYRPVGGGDPAVEVEDHIALMRSVFPGPGDKEGPLGALRDVREAGEYADPAAPGARYDVTQITFERGEVCFQGELVEDDGWHVRGWGRLSEAECEEALARIAEGESL